MVSRTTQYGGGRRLLIWLMLLAFSLVLLGETAHATLYPWGNKPRVTDKVQQDTDDGGWGVPPAVRRGSQNVRVEYVKSGCGFMDWTILVMRFWSKFQDVPQPPVTNTVENDDPQVQNTSSSN
jgi:hypothetical protein